jgi:peptidoglycan/xylan/chitin deacetylase (PgdA/CDA1 family)
MSNLNILVFHKIVNNKLGEWADVKESLFIQILEAAKHNNQMIVSINDWSQNADSDIALSFDDGYLSDYEVVLPLLQKHKAHGTFFIVVDFVGKTGYMSWEQIKQISDAGMEIGSHSLSHPILTTLSDSKQLLEIRQSKTHIEQKIGKKVNSFAYPYGDCSNKTHKAVKEAGYSNICTSRPGLSAPNLETLNRNSVHSNVTTDMIDSLLNPSRIDVLIQQLGYSIRNGLKRTLGIDNYIKIRKSIY